MEHIHGGILCLLCKWISPPWSQAKGQKKIPAQFHHRCLLEYIRASSPSQEKKTGRLDLFLQKKNKKKVNSRQMLASKRSQFFGELYFFWRLTPSGFVFVYGSVVLRPPYGENWPGWRKLELLSLSPHRCRITALEQVVIRVAEV